MSQKMTIEIEDRYFAPFFNRKPLSIEKGQGVYVWDEEGKEYIDFTSGWGVTSIGHASPVITQALLEQSKKIIQNPNSGLTYSPIRAKLLELMVRILPQGLNRIFFANSGAEANDAAIKLARKATGKMNVITTFKSFHGRTISTASATGQASHRDKFKPLMPNYISVPYNDIQAVRDVMDQDIAAVIIEPIQGEGGVNIPEHDYIRDLSKLCSDNNAYLIVDEVQTGFGRTGKMFASDIPGVKVDFLTMAKGIAGGFPFGAFAMTEEIASKLEKGDHGGTYCGNPLGCAVAYAVINHIIENNLIAHSNEISEYTFNEIKKWQQQYPQLIKTIRGKGLLIIIDFDDMEIANKIVDMALDRGLILNLTQGRMIRIFPALNITLEEMREGLRIFQTILAKIV